MGEGKMKPLWVLEILVLKSFVDAGSFLDLNSPTFKWWENDQPQALPQYHKMERKRTPTNMLDWNLEDVLDKYPDLVDFFNSLSRQTISKRGLNGQLYRLLHWDASKHTR